jgi:hypothetical protein
MHLGMTRVQQPIEIRASPTRDEVDTDVEGSGDAAQRRQRHAVDLTTLCAGHYRDRDAGMLGDVGLPPPTADADRTERGSDPTIVHARIVARGPYPPVICAPSCQTVIG